MYKGHKALFYARANLWANEPAGGRWAAVALPGKGGDIAGRDDCK